jgi:hypothetical protein
MGAEGLFPSGPGGHAMPGGAMLGLLVGFITYSLLIGYGIDHLINAYCRGVRGKPAWPHYYAFAI